MYFTDTNLESLPDCCSTKNKQTKLQNNHQQWLKIDQKIKSEMSKRPSLSCLEKKLQCNIKISPWRGPEPSLWHSGEEFQRATAPGWHLSIFLSHEQLIHHDQRWSYSLKVRKIWAVHNPVTRKRSANNESTSINIISQRKNKTDYFITDYWEINVLLVVYSHAPITCYKHVWTVSEFHMDVSKVSVLWLSSPNIYADSELHTNVKVTILIN